MEKLSLNIKIEDLQDKVVPVVVAPNKNVLELLQKLIENPKLNLPSINNEGVKISYGLWFGKENIALENLTFEDAFVKNKDFLVLRSIIGEEEKQQDQEKKWYHKLNNKAVVWATIGIGIAIAAVALAFNWNSIFAKEAKVDYENAKFEGQYMGKIDFKGHKDISCKMTISQVKQDWVLFYNFALIPKKDELKVELQNKKAKIEPANNLILFKTTPTDIDEQKELIKTLGKAKITKEANGKIKFESIDEKWQLFKIK